MDELQDDPEGEATHAHGYHFADAAAALRAASVLRTLLPGATAAAAEERPESFAELVQLLREGEAIDALRLVGVAVEGGALSVELRYGRHEHFDHLDDDGFPIEDRLDCVVRELGGITDEEHRLRGLERQAEAYRDRGRQVARTGPELLRALEERQADLLRFERVFLDSLRMSVAGGAVHDGQRLEATRILERLAKAPPRP